MDNTAQLPDYLMIPGQLILDEDLHPLDGYVYGIVYWYSKLKLQKCIASSRGLAQHLGAKEGSVQNAINRLLKKKYLTSHYDRKTHKRELIPMISFSNSTTSKNVMPSSTTSDDVLAPHQKMRSTTSNDVSSRAYLGTPNKNSYIKQVNKTVIANGIFKNIQDLKKDPEEIVGIVEQLVYFLKDEKSRKFYRICAAKVPSALIFQFLSEIKQDGAREPAKVFTYKIRKYCLSRKLDVDTTA